MTASLFSTVLGTKLPGPGCIYLSRASNSAPVHIGDGWWRRAKSRASTRRKGRAVRIEAPSTQGVLDSEAVTGYLAASEPNCAQSLWHGASLALNSGAIAHSWTHGWMSSPVGGTFLRKPRRSARHRQFVKRPSRPSSGARPRPRSCFSRGQTLGAVVFEPHPRGSSRRAALLPPDPSAGEARLLEALGLDQTFVIEFGPELAASARPSPQR